MSKIQTDTVKSGVDFIFENSMDKEKTREEPLISDKIYLDLMDNNQNNYKNVHLQFLMSSLALKNGILDIPESVIRLPIQVSVNSDVELNESVLHNVLNLKGDASSLINSFQLSIDRKLIKSFSTHNEIPCYYRKISSMTEDYANQIASSQSNFALDDGDTAYLASMGEFQTGNTAFDNKCRITPKQDDNDLFRTNANMAQSKKAHYYTQKSETTVGTDAASEKVTKVVYNYLMEIKLKDIDPIFNEIPLARGMYVELLFNMHDANCSFTSTAKVIKNLKVNSAYGVCPFYLNCDTLTSGNGLLTQAAEGKIEINYGISKTDASSLNNIASVSNPILPHCEFHAVLYKPMMAIDTQLSSRGPVKITYDNCTYSEHKNVAPDGVIAYNLTSSIKKASYLLIHSKLSDNTNMNAIPSGTFSARPNGATLQSSAIGTWASPFTSAPFTCKKYAGGGLTELNLKIGGDDYFQSKPRTILTEQFEDMFINFNTSNGGKSIRETSGLVNKDMWEKNYGVYFIDLKKYDLEAEWMKSTDIILSGRNNSPNTVDYTFFLYHEAEITLDVNTGMIVL